MQGILELEATRIRPLRGVKRATFWTISLQKVRSILDVCSICEIVLAHDVCSFLAHWFAISMVVAVGK